VASVAIGILGKLKDSVEELNVKIAVLIRETEYHRRELDQHSERIHRLESKD
jgi:chaperonin cofactor prefoldin